MYVAIMCGGSGKRFWPKSRESHPKQFLKIAGEKSMLEATFERASKITETSKIFVVTNRRFTAKIKEYLPELPPQNILEEPQSKNTAPCVTLTLFYIKNFCAKDTVMFLPADHLIKDVGKFKKVALAADKRAKEGGGFVIFGIKPRYPETGYGYIKKGIAKGNEAGEQIFKVEAFTEKPNKNKAIEFVESGEYLWNSGMILFSMERLESSIKKNQPKMYEVFEKTDFGKRKDFRAKVTEKAYSKVDSISIDNALTEKETDLDMLECDFGWSDVGSWKALEEIWTKDKHSNAVRGEVFSKASKGLIADVGEKLLVALGAEDLVLVDTDDVTFVCTKDRIDEMKEMLIEMGKGGLKKYL